MNLFILISGIFFTIIACVVLSYVSMATMIGPWIAPAIVLASSVFLKLRRLNKDRSEINKELALIQTIASIGGIIAVGTGFTLPTLYFLDSDIFSKFILNPFYFSVLIGYVCLAAGGLGIWLARSFANKFVLEKEFSFPVSQLIYKIITSQTQDKQAKKMFVGFVGSWFFCLLRDGFLRFKGIFPKIYYIFPKFFSKYFAISFTPMFWAIGFIAGPSIVFPLLFGMISKYIILNPLNMHSLYLPFKLFPVLPTNTLITAFAAGLVVSELIIGLLKYPSIIWNKLKTFSGFNFLKKGKNIKKNLKTLLNLELILVLFVSSLFLFYMNFTIFSQILLLIFIVMATYQISYLGAKIGLITFGRFATFIMIPMMFLFKLDFIQITFLCVFFNICAASASDLLFDYKVGKLCDISFEKIHKYQWLGLIVTSLTLGFILWLLFTNFQLGSAELFAQRAKSRALLIQSLSFDFRIVFLGFLYGVILKRFKISPTMVFGGILMPNNLTIGLVIGAGISLLYKKKEEKLPFWSGVFAGESIWILIMILLKLFC